MLAFPLNVSNFKNLLPKPPRICQGSVFKQAHPCFHVTCPELRVANVLGASDFRMGGNPSYQSGPANCTSVCPAARPQRGFETGERAGDVRKDSSGSCFQLLERELLSGFWAYACLPSAPSPRPVIPENCQEPSAGQPVASSLTQHP